MEQHPPQPSEYQQYAPQNVYGYQQVVTEKPERNKTVNIGLMLLYIYIGITVLSTALEVKVMNEVPAPKDGLVTEILVQNEEMVEFGKGLVRIK